MKALEINIKRKEAFALYSQGCSKSEIARKLQVSRSTVVAWSNRYKWDEKVQSQDENGELVAVDPNKPQVLNFDQADQEFLQEQTISKGMRTLYALMDRVEKAVLNNDDEGIKINIKSLVDAMDKFYRLQLFLKDGGVNKKEIHVKSEKIDWTGVIKESIKAKKQHGDKFDEKNFLETAINKSLGKDK